ncbi:MAG: hypothetical protein MZV70_35065 [Desulfobacterales bacterium]|nr:hypothetical protein [Desulfobacterales bacterium]
MNLAQDLHLRVPDRQHRPDALHRPVPLHRHVRWTSAKSVGMGLAVTFVTVMATVVTWPLYHFVLVPLNIGFLQILVFILVIARPGPAGRVLPEEERPEPVRRHGHLPAPDHHQLRHPGGHLRQHHQGLQPGRSPWCTPSAWRRGFLLSMVLLAGIRERVTHQPDARVPAGHAACSSPRRASWPWPSWASPA